MAGDAAQWLNDNPRTIGNVTGEIALEVGAAALTGGGSAVASGAKIATKEVLKQGGKKALKKAGQKAAGKGIQKNLPEVITKKGIKDPPGTKRNSAGQLINEKTGQYVKDPNKVPTEKYIRSQAEKRKALLRDAKDPNSGLSEQARKEIIESNGKKVPDGYEVSHEKPLYTRTTKEGKEKLDKADNMKTQRKSDHRTRHKICGDQYHKYGPANLPNNPKP